MGRSGGGIFGRIIKQLKILLAQPFIRLKKPVDIKGSVAQLFRR